MKRLYTIELGYRNNFTITSANYEEKQKTFKKIIDKNEMLNFGANVVKKSQLNKVVTSYREQVVTDDIDKITESIKLIRDTVVSADTEKIAQLKQKVEQVVTSADESILKAEKRIAEIKENNGREN